MKQIDITRRGLLRSGMVLGLVGCLPRAASSAEPNVFEVEAFRRPGMTDLQVLHRALDQTVAAGGGIVSLEPGRTYDLGRQSSPNCFIRLRNLSDIRIEGNGARIVCETTGAGKTQLFLIQNCRDIAIANLAASDRGADITVEWTGMDFLHIDGTAGPTTGVSVENVTVTDAVSAITCSGTGDSPRVSGLRIVGLTARRCYYALSFQENGDDVAADVTAIDCRRVYFPYGVTRHSIRLDISHHGALPGADACILIVSKFLPTSFLDVEARVSGVLPWSNLVHFAHQAPPGRKADIHDVTVWLTVDPAAVATGLATPVGYTAYGPRGALDEASGGLERIVVAGCLRTGPGKSSLVYHTRHADGGIVFKTSC